MSDTIITAVSSECNNNAPSYQVDKRQGGRAISVRFAHDNTRMPKLDFRGMKFKISYQNLATQITSVFSNNALSYLETYIIASDDK
jgi:hypothetical protein